MLSGRRSTSERKTHNPLHMHESDIYMAIVMSGE